MSDIIENNKLIDAIRNNKLLDNLTPVGVFVVQDIEDEDNICPGDIFTLDGIIKNKLSVNNNNLVTGTIIKIGDACREWCNNEGIKEGTRIMYPIKRTYPLNIGSDAFGITGKIFMVQSDDIEAVVG